MRSFMRVLSVLSFAVISAGCLTSNRCLVGVVNATDYTIRSVVLVDTNGNHYAFSNLKAHPLAADYKPVKKVLGKGLVLRISTPRGTNVNRIVDLDPAISPKYRGSLLFQIEENEQVRTFFQPDDESAAGDLPWAQAPSWQGTISIPGMPQQY